MCCLQRRRVHHNANYVPYAQLPACPLCSIRSSLTFDCNGVFAIGPAKNAPCSIYRPFKGALYRICCGVNRLGDSGVKVV